MDNGSASSSSAPRFMTGRLLAYKLVGRDCHAHMCCSADVITNDDVQRCASCGYRTDFSFIDPTFRLPKPRYDISSTYDGYTIVSPRVRDLFLAVPDPPQFVELPLAPGFYALFPSASVPIDRRFLRFEERCEQCGQFKSVTGLILFPPASAALAKGIYRTDIRLGGHNVKFNPAIVSLDVGQELRNAALTGFTLHDIRDVDESQRKVLEQSLDPARFREKLRRASKQWWRFW